jgi:glycopeptide antibiotics resistance protein
VLLVTLTPAHGSNELHLRPWSEADAFNTVGNVLLFVPFGVALALLGRSRRATVGAGLALSAAVELAQLAIPGRTTSTADVVLNGLGAALGWWIASRAR